MTPAEQLRAYIMEGMLGDVYVARESYGLLMWMGLNAAHLRGSTYGPFFNALDRGLVNNFILSLAKLYDPPSARYDIRSLPSALAFLKEHRDVIPIQERPNFLSRLKVAGLDIEHASAQSDPDLIAAAVDHLLARLPTPTSQTADKGLCTALDAVRTRRDKRVAHNEHTSEELFPSVTWGEAELLVKHAESVLDAVGFGLFGLVLEYEPGQSFLEGDSARPTIAFKRLLQAASVVPSKPAA